MGTRLQDGEHSGELWTVGGRRAASRTGRAAIQQTDRSCARAYRTKLGRQHQERGRKQCPWLTSVMNDSSDVLEEPVVRRVAQEEDALRVDINPAEPAPTDRNNGADAGLLNGLKDDGRQGRWIRDRHRAEAVTHDQSSALASRRESERARTQCKSAPRQPGGRRRARPAAGSPCCHRENKNLRCRSCCASPWASG
jgi:hypothetical protein